jgi:hypothetical protein
VLSKDLEDSDKGDNSFSGKVCAAASLCVWFNGKSWNICVAVSTQFSGVSKISSISAMMLPPSANEAWSKLASHGNVSYSVDKNLATF